MMADIEVLRYGISDFTLKEYGRNGKLTIDTVERGEEWIPAESIKFAKNGSVYANVGNYYECDSWMPGWYKKGKWRKIK